MLRSFFGDFMLWPLLCLVTFFAAAVQSALGFGFGLIAVAAFVVLFNSAQAIQLVIILTFFMSLVHYPKLKLNTTSTLLKPLIFSCLLGFPIGVWIYLKIDLDILKNMIAFVLIGLCTMSLFNLIRAAPQVKTDSSQGKSSRVTLAFIGTIAGAMATSLAMPGPIVMLYLNAKQLEKDVIRALMTGFFVFSYLGALLFQWLFVGIAVETWQNAFILLPVALLGTFVGHKISGKISQQFFQRLVLIILVSSGLFMLVS